MLNKSIHILNLDNSVINQYRLLLKHKAEIIDLSYLGPKARLWLNRRTKEEIESRVRHLEQNAVTFLGSGDFHHISHILIDRFKQPFSLIIFDFHPDWDTFAPRLGCGSWVTQTLKNKNILKCLLMGVSSSDISSFRLQSGSLASLKDDRLEIYPYSHKPSLVFLKGVPKNISLKAKRGFLHDKIFWDELKGKNLEEFFLSCIKRLPAKEVYVSIDKDCLRKEYALTNWEEGGFSLDELLLMLRLIRDNLDIIGLDISGDYSKVSLEAKFKRLCSKIDHPKCPAAKGFPGSFITSTNEETNLKILELLI